MKKYFLFFLVFSFFVFSEPLKIPSVNPLAKPCPQISSEIQIPENPKPVEEKIVPPLYMKLNQLEPIKVIITLVDPPYEGPLRKDVVAYMEHKFVERNGLIGAGNLKGLSVFPIIFAKLPPDKIKEIAKDPWVFGIEEDIKLYAKRTEGGALISSDDLRGEGGKGNGVAVAVLDSGINYSHPELPANTKVVAQADYTNTTGNGNDDNGHGTACAGIIAGLQGGMAPEAQLWAMKVLDSQGSGDLSQSVEALNYVYDHRNDFGFPVRVVNMSLGGNDAYDYNCDSSMPSMTTIMQKLNSANIAIFVSSGNEGCINGVGFPSCISYAISVGAVYDADIGSASFGEGPCLPNGCTDSTTSADKITCYSNSGNRLDILAPSHCATTPALGTGYDDCFGGTSAAAPYASGVAAQIISLRSQTTPSELKNALKSTGKSITDSRNGVTRKRIDAMEAYQYLAGGTTTNYSQWIAVATHAEGSGGSKWRTDVGIINKESEEANIEFYLYTTTGALKGTVQVPGFGSEIIGDIVDKLEYTGSGAMEVRSDKNFILTSRTFNQTSNGTFGQYLDGYTTSQGLTAGDEAYLGQLTENSSFRTNIAFTNTGTTSASLTVSLYNSSGTLFTSYNVSLNPSEYKQELQPFKNKAGQTNMSSGYAKVKINSGSGIIGYASVVDNKTGDGTTIPLKK